MVGGTEVCVSLLKLLPGDSKMNNPPPQKISQIGNVLIPMARDGGRLIAIRIMRRGSWKHVCHVKGPQTPNV